MTPPQPPRVLRRSPLYRSRIDSALPTTSRRQSRRLKAHVRALTPADMDRVVELHHEGFGRNEQKADLKGFLKTVFFDHPWRDERHPSLAFIDRSGKMVGCIGVMPRPMLLDGDPLQAIVTHNFVVAPGERAGLAAIQLMRAVTAAKPDLALSDGNATARKLSEALGARALPARSGRWFRLLRPGGLGLHLADKSLGGRIPAPVTRALAGLASLPDALARKVPGSPVRMRSVDQTDERIRADELVGLLDRLTSHIALRPSYTSETMTWLLETLARTRQDQRLRVRAVRCGGESVGWYVYYSRPGGVGRVLQLGAAPGEQGRVLEHLFADALRAGDTALSGQSDPAWSSAFEAASCGERKGRTWLLLHTADRRVAQALDTSDAFLSRLEGEAWLHFGY